jgi:hypothetical protein
MHGWSDPPLAPPQACLPPTPLGHISHSLQIICWQGGLLASHPATHNYFNLTYYNTAGRQVREFVKDNKNSLKKKHP